MSAMDFFGPIEVKQRRSCVKQYGCKQYGRAVHIRIAHSPNMNSRLNALRRLVTLRGCSREIRRECEELAASIKVCNRLNVENFCTHRGISPPEARHMGGS